MSEPTLAPSRRTLLKGAGAAGLVIAISLPRGQVAAAEAASGMADFAAYIQIGADDKITIVCPGVELGQGIYTNLPKIVAEELDVDFNAVECLLPYGDEKALGLNGRQTIGGSTSTFGYFPLLRKAGASAREMLVAAAAARWKVPADQCRATQGRVIHDISERVLTYGQVAQAAAKLPVPEKPVLKAAADFRLIGHTVLRKDTPPKVDGSAQFGGDVKLPGLIGAAVVMAPHLGATVVSCDETSLKGMSGVIKVVPLKDAAGQPSAIGVLADTYWQARRAAEALHITWTGGDPTLSSAKIAAGMREMLKDDAKAQSSPRGGKAGDVEAALKAAAKTIDVTYEAPYLAHACMEPMVITAQVKDGACTVWAPTQQPAVLRKLAQDMTGLPREKVTVQTTFAGGGFGRKWEMDYPTQVLQLAIAAEGRPVRLQWTREQDIQNDFYRPAAIARYRAGVDAQGRITAMHGRTAVQSIVNFKKMFPKPGFDPTAIEGLVGPKYDFTDFAAEWVDVGVHLPVGFWRSVGLSQNLFFSESVIDELAHLAGRDPYQLRQELLKDKARELKVLDTVAKMAGWGRKLPPGRGLGIAFGEGFRSIYAQVAEVSVKDNELQVHKVWCALDCGLVMDPGGAIAQIESGIIYGLSAALFGEITIEKGGIAQSNFTDFGMVTLRNAPDMECEILGGGDTPSGVGEAGVPAIAPAVGNAIFAASGRRLRKLPLRLSGMTVADTQRPTTTG